MGKALRLFAGLLLLPLCWAFIRSLYAAIVSAAAATGALTVEAISLLGGMAAFAVCWTALSHPVRTYVLGHELTHALWGLFFGARPSDLRVGEGGGSVRLTKSNMLITLAPYFFPFYTFVVIIAALVTYAFLRPLPFLPLWMFLVGFTWAFHALFTLETLGQSQPDVKLYGKLFSWVFILLMNILLVMIWLAATTPLTFGGLYDIIASRACDSYVSAYEWIRWLAVRIYRLF